MVARLVALGISQRALDHDTLLPRQFGAHQRVGFAHLAALATAGAAMVCVQGVAVQRCTQQILNFGQRIGASCAREVAAQWRVRRGGRTRHGVGRCGEFGRRHGADGNGSNHRGAPEAMRRLTLACARDAGLAGLQRHRKRFKGLRRLRAPPLRNGGEPHDGRAWPVGILRGPFKLDRAQKEKRCVEFCCRWRSAPAPLTCESAFAQAPELSLTRLDCGTSAGPGDVGRFSDVGAHRGLKVQLVFSCYLIKHGDDYMLWDTGHSLSAGAVAPKVSLVDQLAQVQVKPEQIKFVGISHYHADHTGQVGSFPQATLLIGKGDWDVLTSPKPPSGANPAPFAHWISGGGKVEPVPLDKDVFGDGSVMMLATPGHTPGHHSMLVRLRQRATC